MSSRRQGEENVVVAVDKDKGSQYALKWTVDNILSKGHPLTLLHVNQEAAHCDANVEEAVAKKCKQVKENIDKDLFLPFQCFCTRKDSRSPFNRVQYEPSLTDSDVSYTSSGRPSTGRKYTSPYDNLESGTTPSFSFSSGSEYEDRSYISSPYTNKVSLDFNPSQGDYCSSYSRESSVSCIHIQENGYFRWN